MKKNLIIFGAWYLSDVVAELATKQGWNVIGYIDPEPPEHVETLDAMPDEACCFVAIGDNSTREYVTERLESNSRKIISLIHATASLSPSATVGAGSYLGECSVVRTKSVVGRGAIVNAGAVVSHHSRVKDFVLLGPNSAIGSRATVGAGSLLGISACLLPGCVVADRCTVGAGAVVISDTSSDTTVFGNPARTIHTGSKRTLETQSDWSSNRLW